jgi:MarR family transcriptional regulator for hemolysin
MGLSQAKWRTLLHLSVAQNALTQAEIAARLGIEEPTLVTLLHRLEREGWVRRRNASHDRRCNIVVLGRRAERAIVEINAAADKLRHELLSQITPTDLETCVKVLARIRAKAEKRDNGRQAAGSLLSLEGNGDKADGETTTKSRPRRRSGGLK